MCIDFARARSCLRARRLPRGAAAAGLSGRPRHRDDRRRGREAGARSRLGDDCRRIARAQPAGGAARERRRDDGGAREDQGRRACPPTRSARAATICSPNSTTTTASRRCAATSRATPSKCAWTTSARVGEILDLAVGSGATNVSGVRFDLKDRDAAEREALRLAVADARTRAEAAASGANLRVDRVLRIEEQRAVVEPPRPMMMMRQSAGAMEAASRRSPPASSKCVPSSR